MRSEINLIAVTKYVDAQAIAAAREIGQRDFGENYVKPAQSKMEEVRRLGVTDAAFHMIGHLQSNKVRDAVTVFQSLHSLDSSKLLNALEKALAGREGSYPCFIEVNVSGEDSKFGIEPPELQPLLETAMETDKIDVVGLMTMAAYVEDPERVRPDFARLRELRDDANDKLGIDKLRYLSMGMTNDFEVAIEEGATHLRIGTALFKI